MYDNSPIAVASPSPAVESFFVLAELGGASNLELCIFDF